MRYKSNQHPNDYPTVPMKSMLDCFHAISSPFKPHRRLLSILTGRRANRR